ncbi:MAG TPA: glycoside hydrolase family 5 protein [Cellvibrionaceae bacterium]
MAQFLRLLTGFCLLISSLALADAPVEVHGALSVANGKIIGEHGKPVSLAGPSLFWSNVGWNADKFYNAEVVKSVAQSWNAGLIRAAIGTGKNGGYQSHPKENIAHAEAVIDAAIAQGIYVILDWHSHHAEDYPEVAIEFFTHFAEKYKNTPNIIYEIYNEPIADTDWSTVIKPYSEKLIKTIRAIDPNNLITVGTQTWSQDVDKAADDPIVGFDNIAYTLHFYAGTHKEALREKARYAMNKGLALMVTEWGTVNANGDGGVNHQSTDEWLTFMRDNNLSHAIWSLHDKDEGASMLKPDSPINGQWTDEDFTESGLKVRDIIKNWSSQ